MKYLASTHIYVIWVAQSYSFHERNRSIVHGGERDTLSEAAVSSRTVVTFVTWLILEKSFLVRKLFYNDTFVDVLFRGLVGDRKSSRCLTNTSTFVPNDRSQCLYCVLPIMRCAFGAHLDVGLVERRTPCRFVGNLTFPSLFLGKMAVFDKTESL